MTSKSKSTKHIKRSASNYACEDSQVKSAAHWFWPWGGMKQAVLTFAKQQAVSSEGLHYCHLLQSREETKTVRDSQELKCMNK